jgi:Holliday junction resolvase RusA-like endonuclease
MTRTFAPMPISTEGMTLDEALAANPSQPAGRSLTITIPGRPPTPNVSTRQVWQARAKSIKHWRDVAATAADAALEDREWAPLERARLTVTFVLPDRRARDLDNLVASSKVLTDGLVRAGVLAGDSINHIPTVTYGWRLEPGNVATEYLIEEETP